MTFFKVNDPKNRDLIKEVIAKRAVIREADRRRKMGEAFEFEQLSRFFKPITKQAEKMTEKIEKGVRGLPGEIAKILPQPINITRNIMQQMQPPPAYEPPFAGEAEIPEVEEENIKLPTEVEEIGNGGYKIGESVFKINHKDKLIETEDKTIDSENIYNFLTKKNSGITWNSLNKDEKNELGDLIVNSNFLYKDYEKMEYKKPKITRWNNIYKPIWYNRFLYMNPERLELLTEQEHMKKSYKLKSIRKLMTSETKKLILSYFPDLKKGEGLKGSGLKKDYITLPSDPDELVDRLTLLSGSKDAGNTGVYNEMVSICDELLKRKIIGKGQYKQFLSNI